MFTNRPDARAGWSAVDDRLRAAAIRETRSCDV